MNLKKIYKLNSNQIYKFGIWLGLSISYLFSEGTNADLNELSNFIQPQIIPSSTFVFDPFPRHPEALVLPYDSIPRYKGILKYYFGIKKTDIEFSRDWSVITIAESINGEMLQIPFTASVDWYLDMMQQQKWHTRFIQFMQEESKENKRKGRGQMLEVVGVDIGRLGRASLQVSGNVNINGKMVFQDQELVRSTLNETQNTHLEFDQKQNLNIQGKIGDRITVAHGSGFRTTI